MEFDKDRVFTVLDANQVKIGSEAIFADNIVNLKERVENEIERSKVEEIRNECYEHRFTDSDNVHWALAYIISEPEGLKWTDLKPGDIIRREGITSVITSIDEEDKDGFHIYAGDKWIDDITLSEWAKI
jgi:hypothetical protein